MNAMTPVDPKSLGAAQPSPSQPAAPSGSPVFVHKIPYWSGVTGEFGVVVLCLVSIYLSAGKDGDGVADILVIRVATALIELGRIPMAYLARKLGSAAWRSFCFASVLCMGFITAFNVFLPYNEGIRKLIAKPEMTAANIVAVEQKAARLRGEVAAKRAAHTEAETRVTKAAEALANLPPGATGRKSLQGNLADARKAEKVAETEVKTAEKNEKDFAATKQAALDKAKAEHRKEVSGNLIYGAAATLLRGDPAAISPDMMSTAILVITIIPSLVTGFLMSAICLASVERLPPPETDAGEKTFEVSDEALVDLTAHLPAAFVHRVADEVEARQKAKSETPASPSPSASDDAIKAERDEFDKTFAAGATARPARRPRARRPAAPNQGKPPNGDAREEPPPSHVYDICESGCVKTRLWRSGG